MKLDPVVHNEVIMSKPLEEQTFGIAAEDVGVIIEILRDKLYSNKRKIVVQEYMCNARDAHREIGNEKTPIHVKLPNVGMPTFEVRDFGPGITPERMSNVFVRYGASTKRGSNRDTGGYGIGAKSAWSYCDQFGVVTYVDGVERHYSAFLDDGESDRGRVGKIALLHECETDEPNGTKIVVPIQANDFKTFIDYTVATCEFWDVRPTFSGVTEDDVFFPNYTYHEKGDSWHLVKSNGWNDRDNSFVIVDGIKYPIQMSELEGLDRISQRILQNDNVHVFFNTGEVTIAANREALDYTQKTKDAIGARITEMKEVLSEKIGKTVKKCKTFVEAKNTWAQLVSNSTVAWNMGSIEWKNGIFIDNSDIRTNSWGEWKNITIHRATRGTSGEIALTKTDSIRFPMVDSIIVINDAELRPSKPRLTTMFNERDADDKIDYKVIYIISSTRKGVDDDTDDAELQKKLNDWLKEKHLHGKEHVRLSTVEKTRATLGSGGGGSYNYNDGCISVKRYYITSNDYLAHERVRVDVSDVKGYWTTILGNDIDFNDTTLDIDSYDRSKIMKVMGHAGTKEFYAVPERMKHKVTSSNLTRLDDAFNAAVKKKVKGITFKFKTINLIREYEVLAKAGRQLVNKGVIGDTHALAQYGKGLREYEAERSKVKEINELVGMTGGKVEFKSEEGDEAIGFKSEYHNLMQKYAMLSILINRCGYYNDPIDRNDIQKVGDYIALVDLMESGGATKKEVVEMVA